MHHLITSRAPVPTDPGYKLELQVTQTKYGASLAFLSTLPGCRDPRPHRLMQVTLDRPAMASLQRALWEEL